MDITNLSKDTLFLLALDLGLPDILNLCKSFKRANKFICENPEFWRKKISIEFPNLDYDRKDDPKQLYLKLDTLLSDFPEFENILNLIDFNLFTNRIDSTNSENNSIFLLNILKDSVINSILEDYNEYGELRNKKIEKVEDRISQTQNILTFLAKQGLVDLQEYTDFYDCFIKELELYAIDPKRVTFEPWRWEIGCDDL